MPKKYNNDSDFYKDWTTGKLKTEAIAYDQLINQIECYGKRDIIAYDGIIKELRDRKIYPRTRLTFN